MDCAIIKKLPIKSTSIGFYHSLVTKEFMAYHHLQSEWNSSVKPDYVACMGKISENLLIDQGVPKQKILYNHPLLRNITTDIN